MASEAQIAANRLNAREATGPKSAIGKAESRRNALRHGLAARHPVALGEDDASYLRYCDALAHAFSPQNAVEAALVHRIALCGWRLERLYRVEAVLFDRTSEGLVRSGDPIGIAPHAWPHEMATLARYEAMLDRGFRTALADLQKLRTGKMHLRPVLHVEKAEPEPEPAAELLPDNAAHSQPSSASGGGLGGGRAPLPSAESEITKRTQFEDTLAEVRGDMRPP